MALGLIQLKDTTGAREILKSKNNFNLLHPHDRRFELYWALIEKDKRDRVEYWVHEWKKNTAVVDRLYYFQSGLTYSGSALALMFLFDSKFIRIIILW